LEKVKNYRYITLLKLIKQRNFDILTILIKADVWQNFEHIQNQNYCFEAMTVGKT